MDESVSSGYQQTRQEFLSSEFDYAFDEKASGWKILLTLLVTLLFAIGFYGGLFKLFEWLLAK